MNLTKATAQGCAEDIGIMMEPILEALGTRLQLNEEQFNDLVLTVLDIVQRAMLRTGEMAQDITLDVLREER